MRYWAGKYNEHELRQTDDLINDFSREMARRLHQKWAEGKTGWSDPDWTPKMIMQSIKEHVEKGDPIDIANLCAFLWNRSQK